MKYALLKIGYPIGLLILTVGILLISLKGHIINHFVEQVSHSFFNSTVYSIILYTCLSIYRI